MKVLFTLSDMFISFFCGNSSIFFTVSRLSVQCESTVSVLGNRWAKFISPYMFKWKGIYLREWPSAGRNGETGEDLLFTKTQGKVTVSQACSDQVAMQSAFREF